MNKNNIKQFIKYFFTSLGGGATQWIVYFCFAFSTDNGTTLSVGRTIGAACACVFTLTINRKYTFKNSNNIIKQMTIYAIFFATLALSLAPLLKVLIDANVNKFLAEYILQFITFCFDFTFLKFFLFRKTKAQKKAEADELRTTFYRRYINGQLTIRKF